MVETTTYTLDPPPLQELVGVLTSALESNYHQSSCKVVQCPDLRNAPFGLAAEGLSGNERIADIGGQPNLFPEPKLSAKYSMVSLAKDSMGMSPSKGLLIGAGAGPWYVLGQNSELAPNLAWENGFNNLNNLTYYAKVEDHPSGHVPSAKVELSPSADCALMMNLYGCDGLPGEVLRITARGRKGSQKSFTDCIRHALYAKYGDEKPVSMGGVFVLKKGKANFHVMPAFPPEGELPFKSPKQLNDWLTYHDFNAPIVCLTVFHSADPGKKIGLRMEHTHCFATDGDDKNRGGHYHFDLDEEEVEYEAFFNTAKTIHRIDKPEVTLERDLHD